MKLQGLPPLLGRQTRVLILGSFPSVKSLQTQQYYAHPQNQLWRLIFSIISPSSPYEICAMCYQIRSDYLMQHGVGLWDVYASCERIGSLDCAIRHAQLNDLASLKQRCPDLQAIAHNGSDSYAHAKYTLGLGLPVYKLPSSSPANASWRFERKLQVWREAPSPHLNTL